MQKEMKEWRNLERETSEIRVLSLPLYHKFVLVIVAFQKLASATVIVSENC